MDSRSANGENNSAVAGPAVSPSTTNGQELPASTQAQKSFPKDLLPPSLSSLAPHGPINKPARSAGEQAALDKRVHEILQSMTSSSPGSDVARGSNTGAGGNGRGARGGGGAGGAATHELTAAVRQMIKEAYSGQAVAVNEHLARKRRRTDQLDAQLAQLRDEHEMEVRVIRASLRQQQEEREKKGVSVESAASMPNVDAKTFEETKAEGQENIEAISTLKSENIGITEGSNSAVFVNANPALNASGSKDDTIMTTDIGKSEKLTPSAVTSATATGFTSARSKEKVRGDGETNETNTKDKPNNNHEDEHEEGEIGMTD